jgi:hypothetical protein
VRYAEKAGGARERERERDASASLTRPIKDPPRTHRLSTALFPNRTTRTTAPSQLRLGPSPKVPRLKTFVVDHRAGPKPVLCLPDPDSDRGIGSLYTTTLFRVKYLGEKVSSPQPHSLWRCRSAPKVERPDQWVASGKLDPVFSRGLRPQAADGPRTRDLKLGKLALYQLSYHRIGPNITPPPPARRRLRRPRRNTLHPMTRKPSRK